ncbi:unnamed protein product [Aureobasidium uvarum]|uniref:Uncharacterized protein n=1 Tax=Aureobasidium uvarum TaxID=2773716 RepID=A0A9N8KFL1_9PEZI|nr:unnamed protein product [Aureobasidium uvarum]
MPPKTKKRVTKADDYDSDGGFVEDAPQSKRAKTAISKDKQVDEDGNPYWEKVAAEPEPADDEPETNTASSTSKLDRFKYEKKNHEATSDEED